MYYVLFFIFYFLLFLFFIYFLNYMDPHLVMCGSQVEASSIPVLLFHRDLPDTVRYGIY